MRCAVGGDPIRISVGAATTVDLLGTMRAPRLSLEEVKSPPVADLASIFHREADGVAEAGGPRQPDDERVTRAGESGD